MNHLNPLYVYSAIIEYNRLAHTRRHLRHYNWVGRKEEGYTTRIIPNINWLLFFPIKKKENHVDLQQKDKKKIIKKQ